MFVTSSYHHITSRETITTHLVSPLSPPQLTCINELYVLLLDDVSSFSPETFDEQLTTTFQIKSFSHITLLLHRTYFL